MSFDDSSEIERLKQELQEVKAERDYLLAENRRLIQFEKARQGGISADSNELTVETGLPLAAAKQSISILSISSESASPEQVELYQSLFRGR